MTLRDQNKTLYRNVHVIIKKTPFLTKRAKVNNRLKQAKKKSSKKIIYSKISPLIVIN